MSKEPKYIELKLPIEGNKSNTIGICRPSPNSDHYLDVVNIKDRDSAMVTLTTAQLKKLHHLLGEYLAQTEASGIGQKS